MPIDLDQSSFGYLIAVEFNWWTQTRRYCRADHNLTIGGSSFIAVPQLDFSHEQMHGGAIDVKAQLSMPIDIIPLLHMITAPHAPVTVTVYEVDIDNPVNPRCVYVGKIASTIARYRGKTELVLARLEGIRKEFEDVSLGIKVTDRCPWLFGDLSCGFDLPAVTTSATIIDIVGDRIELDSLSNDVVGGGNGYYTRGNVEFEGLRMMIRQHQIGARRLRLAEAPPQQEGYTWLDQVITIRPGCDKSIPTCQFFGRESSFGAVGLKMVPYNPIIEGSSI